jgi:hypothetical protein
VGHPCPMDTFFHFLQECFCRQENTDHFLSAFFDVLIYTFDVIIGPA